MTMSHRMRKLDPAKLETALAQRVAVTPVTKGSSRPASDGAPTQFGPAYRGTAAAARNPSAPVEVEPAPAPRRADELSNNWSGAYICAEAPNRFVRVQGSWIVPNPYPPPLPPGADPYADAEYRSSIWVGLDGHDETSMAMPQVGTAQFVEVRKGIGRVKTSAWWQWWVRGHMLAPQPIDDLTVRPGDLVCCELVKLGSKRVGFRIRNRSSGNSFALQVDAPAKGPKGEPIDISVEGLTAAWIMERPTVLNSDEFYRLPAYGATVIYGCLAANDPALGYGLQNCNLRDAHLITMTDASDPIRPGAVVSAPARRGEDAILIHGRDNGFSG